MLAYKLQLGPSASGQATAATFAMSLTSQGRSLSLLGVYDCNGMERRRGSRPNRGRRAPTNFRILASDENARGDAPSIIMGRVLIRFMSGLHSVGGLAPQQPNEGLNKGLRKRCASDLADRDESVTPCAGESSLGAGYGTSSPQAGSSASKSGAKARSNKLSGMNAGLYGPILASFALSHVHGTPQPRKLSVDREVVLEQILFARTFQELSGSVKYMPNVILACSTCPRRKCQCC